METIHLKISEKAYERVIQLLKQFNANDVQIVSDDYVQAKVELDETLRQIDNNEMKFFSIEEFEKQADELLKRRNAG